MPSGVLAGFCEVSYVFFRFSFPCFFPLSCLSVAWLFPAAAVCAVVSRCGRSRAGVWRGSLAFACLCSLVFRRCGGGRVCRSCRRFHLCRCLFGVVWRVARCAPLRCCLVGCVCACCRPASCSFSQFARACAACFGGVGVWLVPPRSQPRPVGAWLRR